MLIRVIAQHSPSLFVMLGMAEDYELPATMKVQGYETTYYLAERHDHYALYKAALSGWGAAAPNPGDARPVFDPRQR